MNYKIIRVLNEKVTVASDDGTFFNISVSELDFTPKVGDKVNVYANGSSTIVSKMGISETNAGNVNGNSTKSLPKNEMGGGLSTSSKTALIVIGSIIGLFVMLYICVSLAEDSSSADGYEDGFNMGFMMGDLADCGNANISYTIKYGAPLQSEMNHYNNYKEDFMKGCVDGIRANDQ
jgi:hypothetical protein